jgi:(S)-ureidoglycine aminohydrolase
MTRSRVASDHALIAPDSHVWAPLPGWRGAAAAIHIAPSLGARFTQATVVLEAEGASGPPAPGVERFVFPLEGRLQLRLAEAGPHLLEPGDFAYLPPDREHEFLAAAPSRVVLIEKPYSPLEGVTPPEPIVGRVADAEGVPFMGDEDARLQALLPTDERFDMAVNVFAYQPGAALPQVEIHVMEHGLAMLDGAGVYRLGDSWYPVQAGDVIWMKSYCPQWFVAMGKAPARYLYYKDVNRDPLGRWQNRR